MGGRHKSAAVIDLSKELGGDLMVSHEPVGFRAKHSHPGTSIDHLPSSMKKMRLTS